jgi:hypothetical protein
MNYALEPSKSCMETQGTQCFDADMSSMTKLCAKDSETLDRRPVLLSLAVDLQANIRQYALLFPHTQEPCEWPALPGAAVHFDMAGRCENREEMRNLVCAEREAYRRAPERARWLGVACADGSFRLLITFSPEQALDLKT